MRPSSNLPPWRERVPLSRRLTILVGAALAAIAVAAHLAGLTRLIDPQAVLAQREAAQAWVSRDPALAALGFVAAYVAAAALAIPGAVLLSLLGGALFGRWLGTLLVVVGATAGAAIVFLVARSAVGASLRRRAGPLYAKLAAGVDQNAVEVLLFLRLVPVFPFFLVNLAAALFDVRLATFLLTTAVGITPAVFIYASIGRQVGAATSLRGLLSPGLFAALTGLAVLSLVPILLRRWRKGPVFATRQDAP